MLIASSQPVYGDPDCSFGHVQPPGKIAIRHGVGFGCHVHFEVVEQEV